MRGPIAHWFRLLVRAAGGFACVLSFAFSSAGDTSDSASRVPRVLLLYPYDERLPATNIAGEAVRKYLIGETSGKVDLFSEFLDLSRFPEKRHVARMAEYLSEKYAVRNPDVIVALGPESLTFIVANRTAIAPSAKIVFAGVDSETLRGLEVPADVVGGVTQFDIAKTLEMAIRLQPSARKLVVIAGSSEFDQSWIVTARRELSDISRSLETSYLTGLSIDEFVERTAGLSPDSIVLVLSVLADSKGRNFIPREAIQRIARTSGAPFYGPYSTYIGYGVVGGNTVTFESMGQTAAEMTMKAIAGDLTKTVFVPQTFVADARELRRWNLDENALPPDTAVFFKERTLWESYCREIVGVLSFLVIQSLVITALLVERRRRTMAEKEARGRLLEVVHLNQSATAGALSASIAHELNQPLAAIRNNAEAAEMIMSSKYPDFDLVRQILTDIREDDERAGDIILRLRGLLKKRSEIDLQVFDISEVVNSALHILHSEAARRNVAVSWEQPRRALPVRADRIHVQQVILNIVSNALDAMLERLPGQRMLFLRTDLTDGSKAAVSIADTGKGIPGDQLARVFETFYTTKSSGTGLGLSIARAIVETYGGKIWADNRPEGGAVVRFVLPLVRT